MARAVTLRPSAVQMIVGALLLGVPGMVGVIGLWPLVVDVALVDWGWVLALFLIPMSMTAFALWFAAALFRYRIEWRGSTLVVVPPIGPTRRFRQIEAIDHDLMGPWRTGGFSPLGAMTVLASIDDPDGRPNDLFVRLKGRPRPVRVALTFMDGKRAAAWIEAAREQGAPFGPPTARADAKRPRS